MRPLKDPDEITGRLENWRLYDAVYHGEPCVVIEGNCYDDVRLRFRQGQYMSTSFLVGADEAMLLDATHLKEGDVVRTNNSRYQLGKKYVPPTFPAIMPEGLVAKE